MKLGILGGSFNPVHIGHIYLADMVLSKLKLDRIIFIPTYQSPFKYDTNSNLNGEAKPNDRLDMLAAAITGDSRFALDDCEIAREGVSYTIDTLEDIILRYVPSGKPALIIGDDLAENFPVWKKSDRILKLADIVIARRINPSNANYSYEHTVIDNDVMNISSKLIRQKIAENSDWRCLVSPGVRAIIEDRQLYNFHPEKSDSAAKWLVSSEDCSQTVIQSIEAAVKKDLSRERFLHSRNTALLSSDLCRRFGFDPAAGYLAGIAHDLAKQIGGKQLTKIVKKAGLSISSLEKNKPNLLHGKAATVLLRERFNIHNEDVLEAVACHTLGSENMGPLAKVVYIADKTESSRIINYGLRQMCFDPSQQSVAQIDDLDTLLFAVLKRTISKIQAKKFDLSEDTLRLLNKMKER